MWFTAKFLDNWGYCLSLLCLLGGKLPIWLMQKDVCSQDAIAQPTISNTDLVSDLGIFHRWLACYNFEWCPPWREFVEPLHNEEVPSARLSHSQIHILELITLTVDELICEIEIKNENFLVAVVCKVSHFPTCPEMLCWIKMWGIVSSGCISLSKNLKQLDKFKHSDIIEPI